MNKLVANNSFTYGRKALHKGDPFTAANRQDERVLVAIGRASPAADVPEPPPQPAISAQTAAPRASSAKPNPYTPRRQYNRRDLTPEQ